VVKLADRLKRVAPRSIVLIEVGAAENPIKVLAEFLESKGDDKGIYISSNRPTKNLVEQLNIRGFDLRTPLETERIFVIDLVSKSFGAGETKGSIDVASPCELSATQMAFEKAVERLNGGYGVPWLLLDSLSTLLVYNSSGALLHFLHFLIGRLRVLGFDGAIFAVEGSVEESVLSTIKQFCDEVIQL
jgi:KaiC/GvpD/RAD55 family RecA-like ATPase